LVYSRYIRAFFLDETQFSIFRSKKGTSMFERTKEPLLPRHKYLRRLARHGLFAASIIAFSLIIGISGYHFLEGLSWIDSVLNAAMILGGMGPVNELHTATGKLFAAAYALFSGAIFLVAVGVLFAPIFHRFLHRFHLESGNR
jgi:hypothetical protein